MPVYSELSDDELLVAVQEAPDGDFRAFEALARRYEEKVLTNCHYLSGSPSDAEDLAQEVMVKVYYGLAGFEGRSSLQTWIQRVKSNHCINWVRKKRPPIADLDPAAQEGMFGVDPEVEQVLQRADLHARIESVLMEMTETLRLPLVMRDMDGMAYDEISDLLGVGLSAVKMRIKRGREEFRRLYRDGSEESEGAPA